MTILDAIHDPLLFRPLFKTLDTWTSWFVVLKAIFALPMDEEETDAVHALTGRRRRPITRSKSVGWSSADEAGKVSSSR